jgi:hypothetical protein
MMWKYLIVCLVWIVAVNAETKDLNHTHIYFRPLTERTATLVKGSIAYNSTYGKFIANAQTEEIEGQVCIGIKDGKEGDFNCHALTVLRKDYVENYYLYLNDDYSIQHIDVTTTKSSEDVNRLTKQTVQVTMLKNVGKGPLPQVKRPIALVDNVVRVPEQPKSFLQKYWMYIVPVLLMFLLSGGTQEQ